MSEQSLTKAAVALVLFFAVPQCVLASTKIPAAEQGVEMHDVKTIASELEECRLWSQVPAEDWQARKEITDVYTRLAKYPTPSIGKGIALYVNRYSRGAEAYLGAGKKIFAFIRVVFSVPARVRLGTPLPLSVYGNPVNAGTIDTLWPFSMNLTTGELELTGVDPGTHSGPLYDPIHDFDQASSGLRRRFP
jgi:hypothetical protein